MMSFIGMVDLVVRHPFRPLRLWNFLTCLAGRNGVRPSLMLFLNLRFLKFMDVLC